MTNPFRKPTLWEVNEIYRKNPLTKVEKTSKKYSLKYRNEVILSNVNYSLCVWKRDQLVKSGTHKKSVFKIE